MHPASTLFNMLFELAHLLRVPRTGILFLGLLFLSVSAQAQVSLVHATACGPQVFPASTCNIPSTGNGNLLVIAWASNNGGGATTIASITDNANNSYSEAGSARAVDSGANTMADLWFAKNSLAGATVLTITPNPAGTSGTAVIWEFSGASTTAPLAQAAVLNSQAATATPSGAPVTASAGEVAISVANVQGTVSGIVSGNSFVSDSTVNGDGWAHLVIPSAGTYMAQWSNNVVGTYCSSTASFMASSGGSGGNGAANACDLNADGVVNVLDVQLAIDMDLGLISCTADIDTLGVCNSNVVNAVVTAALGGSCVVTTHSVALSWTASISSNIAGYNIYRSPTSGGTYTKVNTSLVVPTTYTDNSVQAGQTYFYVATAVDTSGNESVYSSPPQQAIIPTP